MSYGLLQLHNNFYLMSNFYVVSWKPIHEIYVNWSDTTSGHSEAEGAKGTCLMLLLVALHLSNITLSHALEYCTQCTVYHFIHYCTCPLPLSFEISATGSRIVKMFGYYSFIGYKLGNILFSVDLHFQS